MDRISFLTPSRTYNEFKFFYCDIIRTEYDEKNDSYTFIDLLLDVKIYENGYYEILDMDEVVTLFNEKRICENEILEALLNLNKLLNVIYKKGFPPNIIKEIKKNFKIYLWIRGIEHGF